MAKTHPVYPVHPCLIRPYRPCRPCQWVLRFSGKGLRFPYCRLVYPTGRLDGAAWVASSSRLKSYRVACFSLCLTHWRAANRIGSITNRKSSINNSPNETAISETIPSETILPLCAFSLRQGNRVLTRHSGESRNPAQGRCKVHVNSKVRSW